MKILREIDPMLAIIIALCGAITYVHGTFATIKYADGLYAEALQHSDMNRERMLSVLTEIKESVRMVEDRTWDFRDRGFRRRKSE